MKSIFCAIAIFFVSFSVFAGTLDDLKKVPASRYELGKFELEFAAYILGSQFKGMNVAGTDFKIDRFRVEEKDSKLYFVTSLIGKTREMNQQACEMLNEKMKSNEAFSNLPRNIWQGLTEKQYKQLDSEVILSTEVVSKDNSEFKIKC